MTTHDSTVLAAHLGTAHLAESLALAWCDCRCTVARKARQERLPTLDRGDMNERDYLTCDESDDLRPTDYTDDYQFHGSGETLIASFQLRGRRSLHDRRDKNGCTHWIEVRT